MSLLKKLERRDYGGGVFSNPYGLPPGFIPTNGMAGLIDGGGYIASSDAAMRHYTVFACVRIIADVISTLPIEVFTADGNPIEPVPTRLVTPSAYATRLSWTWQVMASLLLRGNGYGLIGAIDRLGYPTQVDIIAPEGVRVDKDDRGRKIFRIGNQVLTSEQVWHIAGPQMPGDLEGMSPIRYASRTISVGLDAEKFGSDYMRNGIHPTATLETDQQVNSDQAKEIKKRIKDGMANRDLAVLGAGMHLNPWQITAEESQFLETLRHNTVSVAQIFGVPPEMLGAATRGSSITYANREQRAQDFLNTAINPWLARLEESLSAWFPRGTYVRYNTKELLRSDTLTRFQAHEIAIQNNFELPSEARAAEDLPPIAGIDNKPLPGTAGGSSQGSGTNNDGQQQSG